MIRILAFASGTCGIAYELVYARLLTTFLGDMFHVAAAILATFLLGIAIGACVAHRFAGWLWLVEIAIGAIAAAIAVAFAGAGDAILEAWLPSTSGAPGAVVALVFALLLLPAALIGCSVPLFALLLRAQSGAGPRESAFGRVYVLYNLGAAGCVLLAEFVVLRWLGIAATLALLAAINVATGALVLRARSRIGADRRPSDEAAAAEAAKPAPTAKFALAALAIAGVASGVYQMSFFKLAETLFGPYHENFALVLALALAGIVAGTAWVERHPVSLSRWLARGACAVALSFLLIHPLVHAFALLNGTLGAVPGASTLLKIAVLAGLGGLPFAVFGGTVPAHVREVPHAAHRAGAALAAAGVGNCVGYLLAVLWLYATFSDRAIAVAVVLALLAAALLPRLRDVAELRRPAALAAACAALLAAFWPGDLLRYGYETYASLGALRAAERAVSDVRVHRRFDSQISLLREVGGRETLLINMSTNSVSISCAVAPISKRSGMTKRLM